MQKMQMRRINPDTLYKKAQVSSNIKAKSLPAKPRIIKKKRNKKKKKKKKKPTLNKINKNREEGV